MTKEEKIENLEKLIKGVIKSIEAIDKRVSALEDIVYNDVDFIPDFYTQEVN